jgi:hypothetical protein
LLAHRQRPFAEPLDVEHGVSAPAPQTMHPCCDRTQVQGRARPLVAASRRPHAGCCGGSNISGGGGSSSSSGSEASAGRDAWRRQRWHAAWRAAAAAARRRAAGHAAARAQVSGGVGLKGAVDMGDAAASSSPPPPPSPPPPSAPQSPSLAVAGTFLSLASEALRPRQSRPAVSQAPPPPSLTLRSPALPPPPAVPSADCAAHAAPQV